jgi:hypothetical protein
VAIALAAVVAAAATVWVTWRADFLAHPELLAVQKADFILGPVFVGLYWLRLLPASRFGPLLIVYGFVAAGYIMQSSSSRVLFPIGLLWELPIYIGTELLILTFPTGPLDGLAAKVILAVAIVGQAVPVAVVALVLPQVGADFSLSACRALCPDNGLAVTSDVPLALHMADAYRVVIVAVALATIVLLIWRFVTGTPPQRRALTIGTPLGLLFLVSQFLHQGYKIVASDATEPVDLEWLIAGARSLLWYGFCWVPFHCGWAMERSCRTSLGPPEASRPRGRGDRRAISSRSDDGAPRGRVFSVRTIWPRPRKCDTWRLPPTRRRRPATRRTVASPRTCWSSSGSPATSPR